MAIETVNGQSKPITSQRVNFDVFSLDNTFSLKVEAHTIPALKLTQRPIDSSEHIKSWPHLADVPLSSTKVEDVLILISQYSPTALEINESPHDKWI